MVSAKERDNLLREYISRPFSHNPNLNIIDVGEARRVCGNFVQNACGSHAVAALPIKSWHKKLVICRIKQLGVR